MTDSYHQHYGERRDSCLKLESFLPNGKLDSDMPTGTGYDTESPLTIIQELMVEASCLLWAMRVLVPQKL